MRGLTKLAVAAGLTLGLVTGAMAEDGQAKHKAHHAKRAAAARVYSDPGFTYVPARGANGADCDLPSSGCPNTMRIAN